MQVAGVAAVGVLDHEPGEAHAAHGPLEVVRRDPLGDGDDPLERHHHVPGPVVRELEGRVQHAGLVLQGARAGGLGHDRLHLLERVGGGHLVLRLDVQGVQHEVGRPVQRGHDRMQQLREPHERLGQQHHGAVRERDGGVLGHHLAQGHVQEGDHQQREHEGGHVRRRGRDPEGGHRDDEQVVQRRLGHVEDEQGAHRDAELADGQHLGDVLHRVERHLGLAGAGLGPRLDLRPAGAHDGELARHEEGVGGQQDHQPQQSDDVPVHARVSSSSAAGSKRTRSMRRPSSRSTVRVPPSTSTTSPTSARRPRRARMYPPTVS